MAKEHICLFIRDFNDTVIRDQLSVCGIIVDVAMPPESLSRRPFKLALDDGTGVLDVVIWRNDMPEWAKDLGIGDSVVARGTLKLFRNDLQLSVKCLKKVVDMNFETMWIIKVIYEKKQSEEKRICDAMQNLLL